MSSTDAVQRNCSQVTSGFIDPNWPNPYGPEDACIIIYGYVPSLTLCILGLSLFALVFFAHVFLVFRYRTWYFIMIIVGPGLEVVGYVARTLSSQLDPYSLTYFVIQYFFIVIAPVFFSAAIYTVITVMINRVGRQYAPAPPWLILWTFVLCDVVATVLQVVETSGAARVGTGLANGDASAKSTDILIGGLAFQVFSSLLFILCLAYFSYKSWHATTPAFKQFSIAVFIATFGVTLRTIFRLAETADGLLGNLSSHEVFFGCFEFAPVIVAALIFVYWHPGRWLGTKSIVGKAIIDMDRYRRRDGVERLEEIPLR